MGKSEDEKAKELEEAQRKYDEGARADKENQQRDRNARGGSGEGSEDADK